MAYEGIVEISTSKGKVYLTREDGKGWVYDINSGSLLGLRGNPIKRLPFCWSTRAVAKDDFSNLYWQHLRENTVSYTIDRYFVDRITDLEMVYNIVKDKKLADNISYQIRYNITDKKEKLEYIQYCMKNGYIDYRKWRSVCLKAKYKTLFEKYKDFPHYDNNVIYEMLNFPSIAPYYDDLLKHWFLNGMWSLKWNSYDFFRRFEETIKEMEKYNIPYEYNRNFPLWYSQMLDTINVRKNQELNHKFSKAKQNMLNLHYNNEKYEVVIPNSVEEYRAEARAMNNCIERLYLEKVVNGETYIVFVRDKANINAPLVDCEISLRGQINQFLKKCNNRLTSGDKELASFRIEYQNYLNTNIFNK